MNQTSTQSLQQSFRLFHAILTIEFINTSAGSSSFLLTCIKRMAFGADFHMDIALCRSCYKFISAVADNLCLIILRMDSFFHFIHLSHLLDGFQPSGSNYSFQNSLLIISYDRRFCKLKTDFLRHFNEH